MKKLQPLDIRLQKLEDGQQRLVNRQHVLEEGQQLIIKKLDNVMNLSC